MADSRRYHARVARLFLLFLIALLPLRGWTAERMAFAVDTAPVVVSQGVNASMPEECALHMKRASAHHEPEAGNYSGHKGCESCQLCMPLVTRDAEPVLAVAANPGAVPLSRISHFASADPARDVKPPIS